MFVLYCVNRLTRPLPLPVKSAKKFPMVGEVVPATCALYEPLPYSTWTTCTLVMMGPPKYERCAPAGAANATGPWVGLRHGTPCLKASNTGNAGIWTELLLFPRCCGACMVVPPLESTWGETCATAGRAANTQSAATQRNNHAEDRAR